MQVISFSFSKIQAEKKKKLEGKIEIGSNINIKSLSQEKLDIVKDKPVLKFEFEFSVNFKPDIAEILFNGTVLVLTEKDEAKNILKKWKTKIIPDEIRIPLFNLIMAKCNLKALEFEEELNLPNHIPLPKLKAEQEKNKSYTG